MDSRFTSSFVVLSEPSNYSWSRQPSVFAANAGRSGGTLAQELQDRLDDSTGCAARFAHLIGCERRGWLQPAAANVNTSTFVLSA